jgi:glutathione S-transferase
MECRMAELILHHYLNSPFSEKVRLILGFKKLAWRSALVPPIMPKPEVIALTGGYRKTPLMQIGADIYCDTALIARKLEELAPSPTLFPRNQSASVQATAQWIDSYLFQAAVSIIFQPENFEQLFPVVAQREAFLKDRQEMGKNSRVRRLRVDEARAAMTSWLRDFDAQLTDTQYFAGNAPTIADFSAYHLLWFLRRTSNTARVLDPYSRVGEWMARLKSIGHGKYEELSGADAVEIARKSQPVEAARSSDLAGIAVGEAIDVMPADYGCDPVRGTLEFSTPDEVAIRRTDARAGAVVVHFPRMQYEIRKADA